jgi:hypothetical protein
MRSGNKAGDFASLASAIINPKTAIAGADQAKIITFTVNAFNNFGKVLDKTTPLKKLF